MFRTLLVISVMFLVDLASAKAQMGANWIFHDDLMAGLENPKDTIYVEDRKKLEKLSGLHMFNDSAIIKCKSKSGEKFYIFMSSTDFVASRHLFGSMDTSYEIIDSEKSVIIGHSDSIDNIRAYGYADEPKKEIKVIKVKWGRHWMKIPPAVYSHMYEPEMEIEAYLNIRKNLLYVYISGSAGVTGYYVKLVFSKSQYLTRLIAEDEHRASFDFLDATTDGFK